MFQIADHFVNAPGFTRASFDAAIKRAHDEGLTVRPGFGAGRVLVSSANGRAHYSVSRTACTCRAGQNDKPCKHRALAIFLADIMGEPLAAKSQPATGTAGDGEVA